MLAISWLEIWMGFFIVMSIISFLILSSMKGTSKVLNDQDALRIVKEALNNDLIERYEVISVTSNPETSITTVIVSTGVIEIALEINSHTGSIVSKERLAR